jgi:hypothetical protein
MPIPCKVSIDAGTPQSVTAAPTVILQGTNSSAKPVRLKRIELQSNNTGSTQQVITVSLGFYATGTAGGATPAATPVDEGLTGIYTPSTVFKAITTTMGTTFTNKTSWQWNTANPFDEMLGLTELQHEYSAAKVWAIILPTAPTAFNLTGTVFFEEFG